MLFVSALSVFLISLFIFWRKLREDYISSQIFGIAFIVFFLTTGSVVLLNYLKFEASQWITIILPLAATLFYSRRNRIRLNEVVNALAPGFLLANALFYTDRISKGSIVFAIPLLFILLLLILFALLERNFKKFHWYKSGKVGFSGLVIYAIFFFVNAIIAFVLPDMVFFTGKLNALISISVGIISLFNLYTLSKKIS